MSQKSFARLSKGPAQQKSPAQQGRAGRSPDDPQAPLPRGQIRIVLEGPRGEDSFAVLCRRQG